MMTSAYRTAQISVALSVFVFACGLGSTFAETPGEIPKPWTYDGSMKLRPRHTDILHGGHAAAE